MTVLDTGTTGNGRPYLKVLTSNQANLVHRGGNGITVYFDTDTQLNNSFEYSKAFIKDKCVFKVLNSTGSAITKNSLVYQNGFDTTLQLPTIALASAAAAATSVVLGITADDIADGECGTVISEGSVILNTSGFSAEGDPVYLSDTPGATATSAGTTTVIIGRILCVGNPGSISIFSSLTSGANTGGSSGGGGSSTTYSLVASGVVPNNSGTGIVYTGVVGREYVLVAVIGGGVAPTTLSSGDIDSIQLVGVGTQNTIVNWDYAANINANGIELVEAATSLVQLTAAASDEGAGDSVLVAMNLQTFAVTATHGDGGGGTNGGYAIYEKA